MAQGTYVEKEFTRDTAYIEDRITSDGSSEWPVEPGRYRLVVSRACPWAGRVRAGLASGRWVTHGSSPSAAAP